MPVPLFPDASLADELTIRRDILEESVLGGLKANLMHPDLVKEFIAEYNREFNRLAAGHHDDRKQFAREFGKVEREIREIIAAIKSGIRSAIMAAELEALESRKKDLERKLAEKPEPPVRWHCHIGKVETILGVWPNC
jgi:site-specific DNA recombinase